MFSRYVRVAYVFKKMQQIWPRNAERDQNISSLPVNAFKSAFPPSFFWKPVYNV